MMVLIQVLDPKSEWRLVQDCKERLIAGAGAPKITPL